MGLLSVSKKSSYNHQCKNVNCLIVYKRVFLITRNVNDDFKYSLIYKINIDIIIFIS